MGSGRYLISHIDLDGYGGNIIVNRAIPGLITFNVDYNFEEQESMRTKVLNAELVIMTDISVSASFAKEINEKVKSGELSALLIDHHESSDEALTPLGYDWIHITQGKSGTLLAYEYFYKKRPDALKGYRELAENISDYDLWEFKKPYSKALQFLWSEDKNKFVQKFMRDPKLYFTTEEMNKINKSLSAMKSSHDGMINDMSDIQTDIDGNKFVIIYHMGRLASLVASDILTEMKDKIDYLVMFNQYNTSLSFRSQKVPVSPIAEALGGGGHLLAAGARIEAMTNLIETVRTRTLVKIDPMSSKRKE